MTDRMAVIRQLAPEAEFKAGCALYQRGLATLFTTQRDRLLYYVQSSDRWPVELDLTERSVGRCRCGVYQKEKKPCRHIIASFLDANNSGALERARHRRGLEAGQALLEQMETVMPAGEPVRVELTLHQVGQGEYAVSLRAGHQRLYVVKDIPEFLRALEQKQTLRFGKGFILEAGATLGRTDELILQILRSALRNKAAREDLLFPKRLAIPAEMMDALLRLLMARPFCFAREGGIYAHEAIGREVLPMRFEAELSGLEVVVGVMMPPGIAPVGSSFAYFFSGERIVRLTREQRRILRSLWPYRSGRTARMRFAGDDRHRLLSEVLPTLRKAGEVHIGSALAQRIVSRPLEAKVYLDRNGRTITARTEFHYGEMVIRPFSPLQGAAEEQGSLKQLLLLRDMAAEQAVLDTLAAAGFHVYQDSVYLSSQEAVYRFITEGLALLQRVAQVYCSEDFKRMRPGAFRLRGQLRRGGGTLYFALWLDDTPVEELLPILEALRDRRRYFFLKDGTILDLTLLEDWAEPAQALLEGAQDVPRQAEHSELVLHDYQAAYLGSLLQQAELPIEVGQEVSSLIEAPQRNRISCPPPLDRILRPYQVRGFQWMQALYSLGMGGVLADDMGLGKTLQVLALILWAKREEGDKTSLVVCPSSLVYNWKAELERFAPELTARVLEGGHGARAAALRDMQSDPVDVLITSYPLLRKDIDRMREIEFRFAVLDEAQHIKNAVSIGAVAAKQLRAQSRFALTGTPMENHPGELWSIFDFVLPGYLKNLSQFLHRYGEGQQAEDLRRRIRPFLLRRLKKEVLPELPEKIETVLVAEMTPEQKRVYQAALLRLHQRVETLLGQKGAARSQIEVLAALTQLRQICCHPILTLKDYSASSGKAELLLEVLPSALEAGHRVLLFSAFTGMLQILRRTLETQGVSCLYLDGQTPSRERLELVNRFNGGEGEVFLISLKAGGSGLNLTGADMVFLYDPWWNPAAEDQASDRAYRIGQQKKVQVFRLITRDTIEEQVQQMGEAKRALFDALVTAGEQMPGKLSETEIRALFDIR